MIDTDHSGLIGADEAKDGGGGGRQDLWLATCCQLKRRLKPPRSDKRVWTRALTGLHTSPSLLPTCCAWPPPAAPLCLMPLKHHTQIHTLTLHTLHINASAGPGASRTNRRVTRPTLTHTHTYAHIHKNSVSITIFVHTNLQLRSFTTHVCSWQSFSQSRLHYCDYNIKPPQHRGYRTLGSGGGQDYFNTALRSDLLQK